MVTKDRFHSMQSSDSRVLIAGMWDGHGSSGGIVSGALCSFFDERFRPLLEGSHGWSDTAWACELSRYFDDAQQHLREKGKVLGNGGSTGLVVAIVFHWVNERVTVHVANCGNTEVAYCSTGNAPLFLSQRHDALNISEASRLLAIGDNGAGLFQPFYDTKALYRQDCKDVSDKPALSPVYCLDEVGNVCVQPPPEHVRSSHFDLCSTYFTMARHGAPIVPYKLQMSRSFGNFDAVNAFAVGCASVMNKEGGFIYRPYITHRSFSLGSGPAALVLGTHGFWNPFRRTCISRFFCPCTEYQLANGEHTCRMLLERSTQMTNILSPEGRQDIMVAYLMLPFLMSHS